MNPTPVIEELAIAIVTKNLNPNLLNPEFLFYSGIIPNDWELSTSPSLQSQTARIAFTNGINISMQFGVVTFLENLKAKTPDLVAIPAIARKFVETLPHANYEVIRINPSAFFTFDSGGEEAAKNYITSTLLAPGAWHKLEQKSWRVSVNFAYTLDSGQFNLKIEDVRLQLPDSSIQNAVVFLGGFPRQIVGETPQEKLQHLHQLIENWQTDLEIFREVVGQKFLSFPTVEKEMPSHSENEFNWQMADNNN